MRLDYSFIRLEKSETQACRGKPTILDLSRTGNLNTFKNTGIGGTEKKM